MSRTAAEVLALLDERGATLAVAESLTGGLVAAALTAVPGASRTFRGSVTAYATDLKGSVLGVDSGLLAAQGAVDPEVAISMARGVRRVLGADFGLATTGVAGPDPQDGKAVGTVYVAVAGAADVAVLSPALTGDRAEIRGGAVEAALSLIRDALRHQTAEQVAEQRGNDGCLQP